MNGQLCEPLPRCGRAGLVEGVVGAVMPVAGAVDVPVLVVELAALAIAAPPPTRAPVTARLVSSGLI